MSLSRRKINGISVDIHLSEADYNAHNEAIKPTIIDRNSLMTATEVISVIPPGGDFYIQVPADKPVSQPTLPQAHPIETTFRAIWYTAEQKPTKTADNANTFGISGTLEMIEPLESLDIYAQDARELAPESLASFGATLVPVNQPIRGFNTSPYPIAVVNYRVHQDYVNNYLFDANGGGGAFLERHVPPHVWTPLNSTCTGALILGKQAGDQYTLIGVNIPFGYSLHLKEKSLHADSFLVGNYAMALSATDDKKAAASTVIFRKPDGAIQPVRVTSVAQTLFSVAVENTNVVEEVTQIKKP